jgi:hypothetical protein
LGLALGPDGRLYLPTVDSEHRGAVWRIDAESGALVDRLVAPGSGGLGQPISLAFGPYGDLYVGDLTGVPFGSIGRVLRYDGATGAPLPAPGGDGAVFASAPALIINPRALGFGPDGHLFVAQGVPIYGPGDGPTDAILRFEGATGALAATHLDGTFIPDDAAQSGGLDEPLDLTLGPDGQLYVASFRTSSVLRYDARTGAFLGTFVAAGSGGLQFPTCLTFHATAPPSSTTTTTTTTIPPSIPTTTLPPSVCGDGVRTGSEECDPAAAEAACSPDQRCDACRCVPRELCGNCLDDDGNGRTDFEDPACCAGLQSLGMTVSKAALRPAGSASRLALKAEIAGAAALDVRKRDLFVQIRRDGGDELLCAKIPAGRFAAKGKKLKFVDKRHAVLEAAGVEQITFATNRVGSALVQVSSKRAALATPAPGPLRISLGFREPSSAEAGNRCAVAVQPFRAGKKKAVQFP